MALWFKLMEFGSLNGKDFWEMQKQKQQQKFQILQKQIIQKGEESEKQHHEERCNQESTH